MKLVVSMVSEDDDGPHIYHQIWDDQMILEEDERQRHKWGCTSDTPVDLNQLDAVMDLLYSMDDVQRVETVEDFKTRISEKKRKSLETSARILARQWEVEVNSVEFLRRLDQELERLADYRTGMREDGLCIGYGVTPDQWEGEFNESLVDSHKVQELQEWMSENLPLMG